MKNFYRVLDRRPELPECGKIKIGRKGEVRESKSGSTYQLPTKLDHFLITTMERGGDGNFLRDETLHAKFGPKPTRLPVQLIYNDPILDFRSSYGAFSGRRLICRGNGIEAEEIDEKGNTSTVECPCPRLQPGYKGDDRCKINGVLAVLIPGVDRVGGAWRFRTTSRNSVDGITASLEFLRGVTGGQLAGIPLELCLTAREVADPTGKIQKIFVVSLEFRGPLKSLRDIAIDTALTEAKTGARMEQIQAEAKKLLAMPGENEILPGDDQDDFETFFPAAAKAATEEELGKSLDQAPEDPPAPPKELGKPLDQAPEDPPAPPDEPDDNLIVLPDVKNPREGLVIPQKWDKAKSVHFGFFEARDSGVGAEEYWIETGQSLFKRASPEEKEKILEVKEYWKNISPDGG